VLVLCLISTQVEGQLWRRKLSQGEIDPLRYERPFWMGFSITANYGQLKIARSEDFKYQDSLLSMRAVGYPGFGLGGITNFHLNTYFDLRMLPQLHFNQRNIMYTFTDRVSDVSLESISFDLPILLRYSSFRHENKRMYVIAGARFSHDFASREDKVRGPFLEVIATKKQFVSYEFGFGFDIYTDMFKFSPEIKMTNSITNMISPDPYIYNGSIGAMQVRLLQISFHFE
jgi:hypothetical protein